MSDPARLSLSQAAQALARGQLSSVELCRACIEQRDRWPGLNAVVHIFDELALQQAGASDQRRRRGELRGPLDGLCIGIKDNILVAAQPCEAGSAVLGGHVASYDATIVERLRQAGAVLLGKLNLDEFGMGSSGEHSVHGATRNPWDRDAVPGGSSGGSAAAVAAGLCQASLGTDTGGSIRQPAAFCGLTGIKPTYGSVSRYGVIAYASSLDQVGVLGHGVEDVATVLAAITGADPRDSTCPGPPEASHEEPDVRRIGVPRALLSNPSLDPATLRSFEQALQVLVEQGFQLVDVTLPHIDHAIATYYLLATAEASSNLARYDGVRYGQRVDPGEGLDEMYQHSRGAGFGAEVKRRILLGTFALSAGYHDAYYGTAQRVRHLITRDFAQAFKNVNLIATPTTPGPAFDLGSRLDDPLAMYLSDVFTVPVNLAGLCALSLPCGFSSSHRLRPLGLQLIAPGFAEFRLINAGLAYQAATDWHRSRPEAWIR